jgi:hypothetical protein
MKLLPSEKELLEFAEQEELLLFASKSDYLAIADGLWEFFNNLAPNVECEPIGDVGFDYSVNWYAKDIDGDMQIPTFAEGTKLYTIPQIAPQIDGTCDEYRQYNKPIQLEDFTLPPVNLPVIGREK